MSAFFADAPEPRGKREATFPPCQETEPYPKRVKLYEVPVTPTHSAAFVQEIVAAAEAILAQAAARGHAPPYILSTTTATDDLAREAVCATSQPFCAVELAQETICATSQFQGFISPWN